MIIKIYYYYYYIIFFYYYYYYFLFEMGNNPRFPEVKYEHLFSEFKGMMCVFFCTFLHMKEWDLPQASRKCITNLIWRQTNTEPFPAKPAFMERPFSSNGTYNSDNVGKVTLCYWEAICYSGNIMVHNNNKKIK